MMLMPPSPFWKTRWTRSFDEIRYRVAGNVVDCALWDLTAKQRQLPVEQLVDIMTKIPQVTAQTLSLDTVGKMSTEAASLGERPLIKRKLDRELVLERMRAIALAARNSRFIIDANEA